jgi:hypothetical protein
MNRWTASLNLWKFVDMPGWMDAKIVSTIIDVHLLFNVWSYPHDGGLQKIARRQ